MRLAQRAAGKNMLETKRLEGVEQNDVQIPCQAAMLEAVV